MRSVDVECHGRFVQSAAEIFCPIAGAVMIFSVAGLFANVVIGSATDRGQAIELGMINYLWPSLTILFALLADPQCCFACSALCGRCIVRLLGILTAASMVCRYFW